MIPGDLEPKVTYGFPLLRFGLHGAARSGKSTAAQLLVDRFFTEIGLADPMKRFMGEIFGLDRELWGPSEARSRPCEALGGATPRVALQLLGTEWARSFDPDVWVKVLLRTVDKIEEIQQEGLYVPVYAPQRGLQVAPGRGPIVRGVVVSDVRFENEAAMLRAKGFTILHVQRALPEAKEAWRAHASEAGVMIAPEDRVLDNNGSLEELEEQVQALVKE